MEQCSLCHFYEYTGQKVVYENEYCLFLQMPQEVLIGSGLIIPKEHRQTVFDLTGAEWKATYDLLREVKRKLDEEYHPDGYNVGWNCEEVGGQSIPHAHMHVIPRYKDEPYAGKGIRYWLKSRENTRI
ncbi:HIT family protein [Bacillus shivajii]|uniref:HIT family protein n=1 Tax=Bacillus shivajii TaxID=1983719 RepID=UPI001CFA7829|nr:HIT family protein [Bacillus shivajii]UCZ53985.1 HIT family protein [Bacillus shivajii]